MTGLLCTQVGRMAGVCAGFVSEVSKRLCIMPEYKQRKGRYHLPPTYTRDQAEKIVAYIKKHKEQNKREGKI
jgi:hypothetical protein